MYVCMYVCMYLSIYLSICFTPLIGFSIPLFHHSFFSLTHFLSLFFNFPVLMFSPFLILIFLFALITHFLADFLFFLQTFLILWNHYLCLLLSSIGFLFLSTALSINYFPKITFTLFPTVWDAITAAITLMQIFKNSIKFNYFLDYVYFIISISIKI